MRALVTGAAGFLGSHVAESLLGAGVAVTGLDSLNDYYDPALKRRNIEALTAAPGFRFVGEGLDEADLVPLIDEVDVVYHLAGRPGVRACGVESYLRDNVLATKRLLDAARAGELRRFVFASSSSIYGNGAVRPADEARPPRPLTPYGLSKLAGERLCRRYWAAFGVPVVCLRYFTVYGPRQRPDMAFSRFIEAALAGMPLTVLGDGRQSRDFTYVGDAVGATIAAARRGAPGSAYNVAGGSRTTILDAIGLLGEMLGTRLEVRHVAPHPGEPRMTWADTTAAHRELGFAPQTTLEAGLAQQLQAFR
jgi:nucleoside-diphosphate-sugar epimerase